MPILLRHETPADIDAIEALTLAAFGTPDEAALVKALRQQASPLISLVASHDNIAVGHIMASPVTLDTRPELLLMGIAPMAVAPIHQRQGFGSALVEACIACCRELDVAGLVVLGHPTYYPRFGFKPASHFGLCCEYDVPDEAFMALELIPKALQSISQGTIRYHSAFAGLE